MASAKKTREADGIPRSHVDWSSTVFGSGVWGALSDRDAPVVAPGGGVKGEVEFQELNGEMLKGPTLDGARISQGCSVYLFGDFARARSPPDATADLLSNAVRFSGPFSAERGLLRC